jgi:hypothetical protein
MGERRSEGLRNGWTAKTSGCHRHVIESRHDPPLPSWIVRSVMYFDRETVALLRTTLNRAWASLPPALQAVTSRALLAERILRAAARGERDPERLRAAAVHLPNERALKAAN